MLQAPHATEFKWTFPSCSFQTNNFTQNPDEVLADCCQHSRSDLSLLFKENAMKKFSIFFASVSVLSQLPVSALSKPVWLWQGGHSSHQATPAESPDSHGAPEKHTQGHDVQQPQNPNSASTRPQNMTVNEQPSRALCLVLGSPV